MSEAAFGSLLKDEAIQDKFDLHKVETDSVGAQKAFKVDKDQMATKTKLNEMAMEVIDAI